VFKRRAFSNRELRAQRRYRRQKLLLLSGWRWSIHRITLRIG
jgi:hypothetical protein